MHTTINLESDLLEAARQALGTSQTSETIRRARQEAVDRRRREWLAAYDSPDLTPAAVDEMRRNRSFGDPELSGRA